MNNKVLMIAFYYPPSSGAAVQRTLKATEYLPEMGWDPIVLTAKSSAYDSIEESQEIPGSVTENITRTAALDTQNHLSYKRKHLGWMSAIDRWSTWIPGAISQGKKLIKEHRPDVIWSTTPIPSANIIAYVLSKKHDIPWVADYQDPLSYHHYPTGIIKTKIQKFIDKKTLSRCSAAIYATENAMRRYQKQFENESYCSFHTIENGYDEKNWQQLEKHNSSIKSPFDKKKFSLYYSGVLYPNGRDPAPIFRAIKILKDSGIIDRENFELIFEGSGNGKKFQPQLIKQKINQLVQFEEPVPYLDSLQHMNDSDALLLIQDEIFDLQVPGKLYEYIRTGRPILAVTPGNSATAIAAKEYINSDIRQEPKDIAATIKKWIASAPAVTAGDQLRKFSRFQKTQELAAVLDQTVSKAMK